MAKVRVRGWLFLLVGCLAVPSFAGAQARLEFENLAFRSTKTFSFFVPAYPKNVFLTWSGHGRAALRINGCHLPKDVNDRGGAGGVVGGLHDLKYPYTMGPYVRNARPAVGNCNWGVAVYCVSQEGCGGTMSLWWETWDGPPAAGAGGTSGVRSIEPVDEPVIDKPLSSDRIRVPGGDAGTNNSEAAGIRYDCRINGALARGDYDAYAFDFAGGTFRARSESDLDLVADLIRASDGEVLARSGANSKAFNLEGDLEAGRYILTIRVMNHAGAGAYGVVLGNPGRCIVEETAGAEPATPTLTGGPPPAPGLGVRVEAGTGPYTNIGVRVVAVEPGGAAARAGVRVGDILLSVDHQPARDPAAVQGMVLSAGSPAEVVAVRDGAVWTTTVTSPAAATPPARSGVRDLLERLIPK